MVLLVCPAMVVRGRTGLVLELLGGSSSHGLNLAVPLGERVRLSIWSEDRGWARYGLLPYLAVAAFATILGLNCISG